MADTFHVSGYAFASRDEPLACILNNETVDPRRKFIIQRVTITPISSVTTLPGTRSFRRITAMSGGDTVPTIKADVASANLPSQVRLAILCDVTEATEIFRNILAYPISTTSLSLRAGRFDDYFNNTGFSSTIQAVTLAQGEGIALVLNNKAVPDWTSAWLMNITLRIGTEIHYAVFPITPNPGGSAGFGIMNGAGSGVTVEIMNMRMIDFGAPTITSTTIDAPLVRMLRIDGFTGGETLSPVSYGGAATPAQLVCVKNQIWSRIEAQASPNGIGAGELLYPEQNIPTFRHIGIMRQSISTVNSRMAPGIAAIPASDFQVKTPGLDFYRGGAVTGVVLNQQQCFALMMNNPTIYGAYWFEVELTHIPPPSGGGGSSEANYAFIG